MRDVQAYIAQNGTDISDVLGEIIPVARKGQKSADKDSSRAQLVEALMSLIRHNDRVMLENVTGSSQKQKDFKEYIDLQASRVEATQYSTFKKFVNQEIPSLLNDVSLP